MTRRTNRITWALISLTGLLMAQGCPPLFRGSGGGGGATVTPPQPGLSPPIDPAEVADRPPVPGDIVALALLDSATGRSKSRVATGKTGSARECVDIILSLGPVDPAFIDLVITLVDAAQKSDPSAPPLFQTSQPGDIAPAEFGSVTFDPILGAGQYCPPDFVNQELLITITAFGQPTGSNPFAVGTASFVVAPPGGTLTISLASQFAAIAAENSSPLVTDPAPAPGVIINNTAVRTTALLTAEVQGGTPSTTPGQPYMVEFFANDQSLGQVPAAIELNAQNQIVAVARRSIRAVENPADEDLAADPALLAPGAKTIRAVVTDGSTVPATATSVVSVSVNSPLSAVGSAIPNGGLVSLTAVASGGLPPYTFLWSDPFNGTLPDSLSERTQPIATLTPLDTDQPSTAVITITDNANNVLALRPPPNQLTCPLPTIQTGLVDITTPVDPAVFTIEAQNSAFGGPITFTWSYSATAPDSGFVPLADGDRGGRVSISQVGDTATLTISGVLPEDDGFYMVSLADNCGTATTTSVARLAGTSPTVQTIVRQNPLTQLTAESAVVYRVTFSEDVNNVDVNDFTLVDVSNAITGEQITSVNEIDRRTYDVTVNTGSAGTGDLRLDVIAATATIEDDTNNPLSTNFTSGEVYSIDHDAPTVTSIVRQNPAVATPINTALVDFCVTFSEAVSGVDIADFTLVDIDNAITGESIVAVNVVDASTYDVRVNTGTAGTGGLRLDVTAPPASIEDAVGNAFAADFTAGEVYSIDHDAPTVVSIDRQNPANQATNQSSVIWRVTFSEDVENVDIGDFTVTTVSGLFLIQPTVTSVSAASGTTIDVTVDVGQLLLGTGEIRLDVPNGASINDPATNALAAGFNTGQTYIIDPVPPSVTSIVRQNPLGQNTNASSVIWRVNFSENVNDVSVADFTLVDVSNSITGESITSVSAASGTSIDVTVNTGSAGTGDLRLDVIVPGATITDDAGNELAVSFTTGQVYTVDHDAPTVLSIVRLNPLGQNTNAASVTWRVTFSENVNDVDTADFTLVDVSNAITGESIDSVSANSGTVIDVTVNTGTAGTGDLRLDVLGTASITDDQGNDLTADFTSGEVYSVDLDAPTVVSINRQTPAGQNTNASSVTWRVTFSENVNGVATGDFTLVDVSNAITGESITSVSAASGTTIDVTVNTGSAGTGDLRLDVIVPGATITDDVGNELAVSFTSGQVYTVDHDAPTVVSINRQSPSDEDTNASSVTWRVTFSENVNGVATGDFTLVDVSNTITGESITSVSANSGTTIDVTVSTGTAGTGDLRLDVIVPGATITDDAGNSLSASFTTGQVYSVDLDAPTVVSVTVIDDNTIRITFSEAMAGSGGSGVFDEDNYTITGTGIGNLNANPSNVTHVAGNTYELTWLPSQHGAAGGDFTITVTNVTDLVGNAIDPGANSADGTFPP